MASLKTPLSFIHTFIKLWFVEISLRRHALMVEDGAFSHKIDHVTIFKKILNLKGQIALLGQKLRQFC